MVKKILANNSACYTEKPDMGIFMSEWKALYDSKSGEEVYSVRESAQKQGTRMVEEMQTILLVQILVQRLY